MDYLIDVVIGQYWPAGLVVVPVIAGIWVGFKKIAKFTPTKADDKIVEDIESNPVGKKVSEYLEKKSPV